ncbi:MAG: hypothetical protein AB8C13_02535 [Phycisphaerales bacterium]
MKLKTYTATTMAQALAQVRKDLGAEAMILHTRSYRTGSWLGLGGKPMVEITASSPQPAAARKLRKAAKPISAKDLDDRAQLMSPETMSKHEVAEPITEPITKSVNESVQEQVSESIEQPASLIESSAKQDKGNQQDDRAILLQGLMGSTESIYAAASSTPRAHSQSTKNSTDAPNNTGKAGSADDFADGFTPTNFDRITSNIDLPDLTTDDKRNHNTDHKNDHKKKTTKTSKASSDSAADSTRNNQPENRSKSETEKSRTHQSNAQEPKSQIDRGYEASTFRTLESIDDLSDRVSTELSEHDRTLKEFTKDLRNTREQQSKLSTPSTSVSSVDSGLRAMPNKKTETSPSKANENASETKQDADFQPVSAFTKPIPTESASDFVSHTLPEPTFEIQSPPQDTNSDSVNIDTKDAGALDPAPFKETPEIDISQNDSAMSPSTPSASSGPSTSSVSSNQADTQNPEALQAQINILQKMMGQVLETTRRTAVAVDESSQHAPLPPVQLSESLSNAHASMVDNDVPADIADRFVGAVMDRLDHDELDDASVVRHAMLREIEQSIQTVSDSVISRSSSTTAGQTGRPKVLALIGPTGVGKTTTVAKLAATAKLRHGMSVALITSDTYRIAAVEQLKTYASIIGLELRIANNPEEMKSQIESLGDRDLVVIDTAGRSQNNHSKLDELGDLITAAQPDETHLVLSATVGDNVLGKTAARFRELGPDRCILTKIDEAVTTGMIASVQDRIGLPLSFVTVGQEVPDDILPARADRLARAVLDGPDSLVPQT